MNTEEASTVEFRIEDVERFEDRLAHAQQYMDEALQAVRDAIALLPDPVEDKD
jgi:hypothetical protein